MGRGQSLRPTLALTPLEDDSIFTKWVLKLPLYEGGLVELRWNASGALVWLYDESYFPLDAAYMPRSDLPAWLDGMAKMVELSEGEAIFGQFAFVAEETFSEHAAPTALRLYNERGSSVTYVGTIDSRDTLLTFLEDARALHLF